jgi:hypothetical protein
LGAAIEGVKALKLKGFAANGKVQVTWAER